MILKISKNNKNHKINFSIFSYVYDVFGRSGGSESAKAHFGHFGALWRSKNSQVKLLGLNLSNFDGLESPNGTWGTLGVSQVHLGAGGAHVSSRATPGVGR